MPNVSPFSHASLTPAADAPSVPDRLEHHPSSPAIRIFVLADRDSDTAFSLKNVASVFTSLRELCRHITLDLATIVIDLQDADQRAQALRTLRGTPEFALLPLLLAKSGEHESAEAMDLADGIVGNPAAARERGAEIWRALGGLKGPAPGNTADTRLLRFLHTRPGYQLVPRRSWNHPLGYHYPLLDALRHDSLAAGPWLESLSRQKLIESAGLIARTRHCPSCDYSHLNYVDVCTNCSDAHIEKIPFLHCFACGNIAPDMEFARVDHLACSKCATRLRQIGVDYDRALLSFRCKPCGACFQEPRILAECLHCGKRTAPHELSPRDIHTWRASELGHTVARSGGTTPFTPLDSFGFAMPAYFAHMLEWMLRLHDRHAESSFGILTVRVRNSERIRAEMGLGPTSQLMDDLAMHIRQTLRSTDIATRTTEYDLFALLPYTDRAGCERARTKIRQVGERFHASNGSRECHLEISVLHSSALQGKQRAENIIAGNLKAMTE